MSKYQGGLLNRVVNKYLFLKLSKQGENEVQGHLFLGKPLPGMGRKADDTCEKFNELYFSHPKGIMKIELRVFQPSKLMTCTDQQSKSQDSQSNVYKGL